MSNPSSLTLSNASNGKSFLDFSSSSGLLSNSLVVGAAWLVSSALFTTYTTTKFLQYQHDTPAMLERTSHTKTLSTTSNKRRSNKIYIPRSTLLTLYRFGGSLLLGLLLTNNIDIYKVGQRWRETLGQTKNFAWPAFFLYVANFSNAVSLNKIGISLTYTSKCGIPLITALLTLILDGTKALPSTPALLALLPIAVGIAAASWNAPTLQVYGLAAAIVSTVAQSALNVSSKRVLSKTGISGIAAQRAMVAVGLVIAVVMTIIQTCSIQLNNKNSESIDKTVASENNSQQHFSPPAWLSIAALTAYHIEYVLSFLYVSLVSPITYGASDAVRRLAIIVAGRYMFGGNKLSRINTLGIALALVGAACYSIANSM